LNQIYQDRIRIEEEEKIDIPRPPPEEEKIDIP
jgi:hypothetical protein